MGVSLAFIKANKFFMKSLLSVVSTARVLLRGDAVEVEGTEGSNGTVGCKNTRLKETESIRNLEKKCCNFLPDSYLFSTVDFHSI